MTFIHNPACPKFLKLEFDRVKIHYLESKFHVDPTNADILNNGDDSVDIEGEKDCETEQLLKAMDSFTRSRRT